MNFAWSFIQKLVAGSDFRLTTPLTLIIGFEIVVLHKLKQKIAKIWTLVEFEYNCTKNSRGRESGGSTVYIITNTK